MERASQYIFRRPRGKCCIMNPARLTEDELFALREAFDGSRHAEERIDSLKVLIVDDDSNFRDELQELLVAKGWGCLQAKDAEEARRLIREEHTIGVVLVDLKMPGECGLSLIKALRETYDNEFDILVASAHGDMDSVIEALRLHVTDFLQKPIDLYRLFSILASYK